MGNSTFFETVNAELWADFQAELSFPSKRPLLAHYTSIQTFERIVSNDEFWFSNPLLMNDVEELKFGIMEGAAEFRRSKDLRQACPGQENYDMLQSRFEYLLNEFETNHALTTFLLCFSEHAPADNDGLLSMWRGYGNGGAGAAIVIDTAKLDADSNSPLIIGEVRYGTRTERSDWLKQSIKKLADVISKHAKTEDDYHHAAVVWFERLKSFALFTKHSGFHEEKEWRVVYMSERDKEKKFARYINHLATNRGIEPKLKLPLKGAAELLVSNLTLENLIERIILGPSISSALGVASLKLMLKTCGKEELADRIVGSDIPFRQTS